MPHVCVDVGVLLCCNVDTLCGLLRRLLLVLSGNTGKVKEVVV